MERERSPDPDFTMTTSALSVRTFYSCLLGMAIGSTFLAALAPVRPWGWQGGTFLFSAFFFAILALASRTAGATPRPTVNWLVMGGVALLDVTLVKLASLFVP